MVSHASEVPAFPKMDGSGEAAAKFSRRRKQKISGEKGVELTVDWKNPITVNPCKSR